MQVQGLMTVINTAFIPQNGAMLRIHIINQRTSIINNPLIIDQQCVSSSESEILQGVLSEWNN